MSELVNFTQIVLQAEQDAIDAFSGATVFNPYANGSVKRDVWQKAFDRKLAELRGQK